MRTLTQTLAGVMLLALMSVAPISAQEISVDISVARDIVDRMPMGEGEKFPADVGEVWCWTRVTGADPGTVLEHVWMRGTQKMAIVPLEIGGPSWRTYSSKTIPPEWSGDWYVYVRDTDGYIYAIENFTVGEAM
ncbi:MAG TPA: DUF2914 domain-containing protein [Gammaproteobacteria bacterium]|nr:DUF2914 domain-containing protein [Gammaproteobacteria bacterium]